MEGLKGIIRKARGLGRGGGGRKGRIGAKKGHGCGILGDKWVPVMFSGLAKWLDI